jgi:hypothetical protein
MPRDFECPIVEGKRQTFGCFVDPRPVSSAEPYGRDKSEQAR